MGPDFAACVRSLSATLLAEQSVLPVTEQEKEAVADHLLSTTVRMPDHLRLALRMATLFFDALAYPVSGRPFHKLGLTRQQAQLRRLDRLPIGPIRSLTGFYRTLSVHALWSLAESRAAPPSHG